MMKYYKKYESFIRFLLVGATATLIDFIIYMLLSDHFDITLSKCASMAVASVFSFFMNRKWTFESNDVSTKTKLLFGLVVLINIAINSLVNRLVYQMLGNKVFAFCIATGVAMIANYFLQRNVVFKKGSEKK